MRKRLVQPVIVLLALLMPGIAVSEAIEEIKAEVRYLYVQPGQTLHNIVSKLYPSRIKEWPRIREDIIRLNPHAFVDGKASQMKAGVRLELPEPQVFDTRKANRKAPKHVGDVVLARGQTLAVGSNKVTRKLSAGDKVYLGDKLITGETGFMRLHMIDEALLDLRCYSIMVIEQYALTDNRASVLNLLQGSLRKVTGEIGKWTEDVYELRTPVASVGVRGTEYALRVFQTQGCDGSVDTEDEGLYLKVIKGLVDVHNNNKAKTETVVAKGDTLYVKTPESVPQKNVVKPGVIEPVVQEQEEESYSFWWWLLGAVVLIAAL